MQPISLRMNMQLREPRSNQGVPPAQRLVELSRGDRLAICESRFGGAGWDVRLVVHGELWYQERCVTWKEAVDTAERWKLTLWAKGWRAAA